MITITPTGVATLITDKPKPRRLTNRRILLTLGTIIALPFLVAFIAGAFIGISKGIDGDAKKGPDTHTMQVLNQARIDTGRNCWAEWNETQNGFEVICAAK